MSQKIDSKDYPYTGVNLRTRDCNGFSENKVFDKDDYIELTSIAEFINYITKHIGVEPLTIVVDGTTYTAEFNEGFVRFGCATIDNVIFLRADEFLKNPFTDNKGNRMLEAIKIGKGLFTPDLIAKIANKIKEGANVKSN